MRINSFNFNKAQLNKNYIKKNVKVSFAGNDTNSNKKPEKKLTFIQKINIFCAVGGHGVMGALLGMAYKILDNQKKKLPENKGLLLSALYFSFLSVALDIGLYNAKREEDL